MTLQKKFILETLATLRENNIIKNISQVYTFNDDPKIFHYMTTLFSNKKITDGFPISPDASGYSFSSKEFALFKCLAESIERLGTISYTRDMLLRDTYTNLEKNNPLLFNPSHFSHNKSKENTPFQWVKAKQLSKQTESFLPAQLVFINYTYMNEPALLPEVNTTGCAGGIDHESTLLRALFEAIEREAYIAIFLAKLTPPRIALETHPSIKIKKILQLSKRYNLELHVFDITNDLQVPSFMTLVIDQTGIGQALTVGLKSHFDPTMALLGSIEESFNTRPGFRKEMYNKRQNAFYGMYKDIDSFSKRSLFWSSPHQLKKLSFLFKKKETPWTYKPYIKTEHEQLQNLTSLFQEKNMSVYYVDITPKSILQNMSMPYLVYKVFIPQLQPFYIRETAKQIHFDRIQTIARHFGENNIHINELPHIFL